MVLDKIKTTELISLMYIVFCSSQSSHRDS